MSSNFFAALDDSGDEGPPPSSKPAAQKKASTASKPAKKAVVEPSKPDDRKRPVHGDRNTKFGRGGRAPVRDGKRAYDRRSGTGRGKEIKKGGGGAHNWGSDKNDAKAATGFVDEDAVEQANETTAAGDEAAADVGAPEAAEASEVAPEPVVDNTMSYEEYLAAQKEKQSELLAPVKERKVEANEFANLQPAAKAQEEDFLAGTGGKQKRKKAGNAKTSATELLGNLRVGGGESSGGGGRGGRGGRGRDGRGREGGRGGRGRDGGRGGRDGGRGRGGRGRDSGRGGRGRDAGRGGARGGGGRSSGGGGRINVQDETAFPSL